MRIGIDYRFAVQNIRGISNYIRNIVQQLAEIDRQNEYFLYVNREVDINLPGNFFIRVIPCNNIVFFEQILLPREAKKSGLDILWYPSNSGPIFLNRKIKLLVTVHDLAFFKPKVCWAKLSFKEFKFRLGEQYRKYALKTGLSRINKLLTISAFSAGEVERYLFRKADIIYNNVEPIVNVSFNTSILERLRIASGNYVYSLTGDAPHKNLAGLISVFDDSNIGYPLVISGVYDLENAKRYIRKDYQGKVIFTGLISEEEKNVLYKHAKAFIFLSTYEGFGVPLLEAMRFGLPVIASNRASIPEIVGDAGELVEPENISGIRTILKELPAGISDIMKERQQNQLAKFSSWRKAAIAFLETCKSVYE